MKPVDQTTFGFPGGNCFSACVATLLGLSIDDVPYFMEPDDWFQGFLDWLAPRGWWAVTFKLVRGGWSPPDGALVILGGESPRGPHACVGRGRRVVHDPHPSRDGLIAVEDVTLLIPMNPRQLV